MIAQLLDQLRPYQLDVLERLRHRLRERFRRIILQAPCGAGKTHISSEMVRCAVNKGSRVLFLAHRRRLIDQKSTRLTQFGVPHGILMRGVPERGDALVQVASRDTLLSRNIHNRWKGFPPADLVILDECHNLDPIEGTDEADVYQQILRHYPQAVVVGLTATPARSDGHGLGNFWDTIECTVPTSQLISEGWLVPVTCYAPDQAGANRKGRKLKGLVGDPVQHWLKLADGRPTILFAAKCDSARAVCKAFNDEGIVAEYMDAHTPDDERQDIISRVETGKTKIICNVGLFVEGADVPCLSCCILLRAAKSLVLFTQATGRIMRPFPGKTDAILIDHAGAVWKHGFPDEDREWSLEEKDTVQNRIKKAKKTGTMKTPICCPACGRLYSGTIVCPACGHVLPHKQQPQVLVNEMLVKARREMTPDQQHEYLVNEWHKCLRIMAYKGRTAGAAAAMFKGEQGHWPANDFPNVPHGEQWKQLVRDLYPQYIR